MANTTNLDHTNTTLNLNKEPPGVTANTSLFRPQKAAQLIFPCSKSTLETLEELLTWV